MTRQVHVFLSKRPIDKEEWPLVYTKLENAEAAYGRCSRVITVDFDAEMATPKERVELENAVAELRAVYDTTRIMEAEYANPLATGMGALLDLVEGLLDGRIKL